jgi:aryl-alcohol dehydrogenase-like predicted oxidoreductase
VPETIRTRPLGPGGTHVPPIGMGCWAIGGPVWAGDRPMAYGETDDEEALRAIRRALELGVTLFDTANTYGAGHSEQLLGQALAGQRDRVLIATKFGNTADAETRQLGPSDLDPAHVRDTCVASLRRLGTDYVDLYQLHINDAPVEAAVALWDALDDLVAEGLIRAYGWSTDFPERARTLAGRPAAAAVQHDLNVLVDAPEVLAVCDELDLTSLNRLPLAMGLLTGKYDASSQLPANDIRGIEPEWMKFFRDGRPAPEWLERLAAIREVLTSGGRTLAQGALAWIWARSPRTIPLPGFKTVAQVEENAGALRHGPLTPAQLAEIDELLGRAPVVTP